MDEVQPTLWLRLSDQALWWLDGWCEIHMACDGDLQQEVLRKTLDEVACDATNDHATPCVICLEQVRDVGVTIPCKHRNFDFLCLVSWLQQRRACPLCQTGITGVKYNLQAPKGPEIFYLPSSREEQNSSTRHPSTRQRPNSRPERRSGRRISSFRHPLQQPDDPLGRRRYIYRRQLYSQHVGSNRLSQYREFTPQLFNRDENLVSRARKWVRRELQVFEFLDPDNADIQGGGEQQNNNDSVRTRRARNAEFLLEYIIAILRTVDIKGSGGQAEELLQEFIGRENARLFLHELQAWLRSPFNSLQDWDRAVQYDERAQPTLPTIHRRELDTHREDRSRSRSYMDRTHRNESRGLRKHRMQDPRPDLAQVRRVERARRLYQPD
ncbi:C3HC4 type (RING finger) zinc finger containing protein [Coccidioides posadasii C735 delta SOWgp]|uniref:RING-type E3 ubiquitin transferase n=1 Tax=Coccidioides posadasii (strain C735) TaxID=222929 RepID=C5PC82_COCP7|nr:C3HC4 type (RING finger) zinc finger containing protein [Coccidioides posadasii C735 delta SOWgp]EER25559.1 C3HC4 type (RING finger) zinc finger containing protein [Coccidioides posadasii C735 delta SOWgp]|eukprot:XP_003067704.1 C3HC4 type (RING finger) zinc finger containing protein [Coccidioides posadasii C735 delta SOWgp]